MPIYKIDGVKKDGLQKYKVRINYVDSYGKSKQPTRIAWGYEAAKDLERKLLDNIKDNGENSVKKITVQQLYDEYVVAKKREIREVSADFNEQTYRLYIKPTMETVCLNKLTVPMLQKWKIVTEQKNLAVKTMQHAYSVLRALLNYAVKMEYISRNPLLIVGNFKDAINSVKKSEVKYYTASEFTRFINVAKQVAEEKQIEQRTLSEWDFHVFFYIAFYTGMRKGEIFALKWCDIDDTFLSITRSITQKLKGDDRETPPKNRSSIRTLQMPLPLVQVLTEHRKRQEQLEHFTSDYRICGGERCIRDTTLQIRNDKYANLAGLHRIRIHAFRHSHVSVLANEKINIQEIARRLGHSKIEQTWNTYCHLYPREEERAVEILNMIV